MLPSDYCNLLQEERARFSEETVYISSASPKDFMVSKNVKFAKAYIGQDAIHDKYVKDLADILHDETEEENKTEKENKTEEYEDKEAAKQALRKKRKKDDEDFYNKAMEVAETEKPLSAEAKQHLPEWYEFLAKKACKKSWYKAGARLISAASESIKKNAKPQPNGLEELVKERQFPSKSTNPNTRKTKTTYKSANILEMAENYLEEYKIENGKIKRGDLSISLPNPLLAYEADKVVKPIDDLLYSDDPDKNLEHSTRANSKIMLLYYNMIELAIRTAKLAKEPTGRDIAKLAVEIDATESNLCHAEILTKIGKQLQVESGEWQPVYHRLKEHIENIAEEYHRVYKPKKSEPEEKPQPQTEKETTTTEADKKTRKLFKGHSTDISTRLAKAKKRKRKKRKAAKKPAEKTTQQLAEEAEEKLAAKRNPDSLVESAETLLKKNISNEEQTKFAHRIDDTMARLAVEISDPQKLVSTYDTLSFTAAEQGLHLIAGKVQHRTAQVLAEAFSDEEVTIALDEVVKAYQDSIENYQKGLERKQDAQKRFLNQENPPEPVTPEQVEAKKIKKTTMTQDIEDTKKVVEDILTELEDFKTKNTSHDTKQPSNPDSKTKPEKPKQ